MLFISKEFRHLLSLRAMSGAAICDTYGDFTKQRFDYKHGIPVIIPTHNEEHDLPLNLLALARSSVPLAPIVVDNSTDRTVEFAKRMGARVVREVERGQMKAYQTGLLVATTDFKGSPIIITDADTIPQQKWVETMLQKTSLSQAKGGVAFGRKAYKHGPSFKTDLFRTIYAAIGDSYRYIVGRPPRARGVNCLVQPNDTIMKEILECPPKVFPCDAVLSEAIQHAGGEAQSVLDLHAVVYERNDRFTTIRSYIAYHLPGRSDKQILYYQDHGYHK
jgi:glycosyltransferase involved in cell wall biosynthesis